MESDKDLVEKGSGVKSLVLFLAGTAIGVGMGILLAPDSGKENRRKLAEWIKEKRRMGRDQMLAKKELVAAAIHAGKQAYKDNAKEKTLSGV